MIMMGSVYILRVVDINHYVVLTYIFLVEYITDLYYKIY